MCYCFNFRCYTKEVLNVPNIYRNICVRFFVNVLKIIGYMFIFSILRDEEVPIIVLQIVQTEPGPRTENTPILGLA